MTMELVVTGSLVYSRVAPAGTYLRMWMLGLGGLWFCVIRRDWRCFVRSSVVQRKHGKLKWIFAEIPLESHFAKYVLRLFCLFLCGTGANFIYLNLQMTGTETTNGQETSKGDLKLGFRLRQCVIKRILLDYTSILLLRIYFLETCIRFAYLLFRALRAYKQVYWLSEKVTSEVDTLCIYPKLKNKLFKKDLQGNSAQKKRPKWLEESLARVSDGNKLFKGGF